MTTENESIERARARLRVPELRAHRPNSAAVHVRYLLPEIQAARREGKSWKQIAADISDTIALNKDAVRIAYGRAKDASALASSQKPKPIKGKLVPRDCQTGASNTTSKMQPTEAVEDAVTDMFGPLVDARDMRRLSAADTGESER